ncbi:hypothetical protein D3C77_771230 [compost metagenome]
MNAQVITLFAGFDTFGHQGKVEFDRQFDDAVENVARQCVDADHGDKTLVDFQKIDIELPQVAKA